MLSVSLVLTIILALSFDFINGFHDTANTVATTISTRVLSPKVAIVMSAACNFLGAFLNQHVAGTVAHDIVNNNLINLNVIIFALVSAIIWNLLTWYFAIPSSSSHALFGSLIGATIAYTSGFDALKWSGIMNKVIIPLFSSPVIGLVLGYLFMNLLNILFRSATPRFVNKWFSKLQIVSAAVMSFSHGNNDAQKSMGIITMALIASNMNSGMQTTQWWVIVLCAVAMALGTSIGGMRIIKTVGVNIMKMSPINGFAAQTSAAIVIQTMTLFKAPISTTHVITTAVMGVGASKRLSAVRWSLAKSIAIAWVFTIPVTALIAALLTTLFKSVIG
ncbi:MAG: inorganic phosphate transporter [Bacillota bacterium]|nr:inorganic phosphate transporter [Bacillota bacterium]